MTQSDKERVNDGNLLTSAPATDRAAPPCPPSCISVAAGPWSRRLRAAPGGDDRGRAGAGARLPVARGDPAGRDTDTGALFSASLPWRQRRMAIESAFPRQQDLLVAVVDGATPEEAEETADALAAAIAPDQAHFRSVERPDNSPYLVRNGSAVPRQGQADRRC